MCGKTGPSRAQIKQLLAEEGFLLVDSVDNDSVDNVDNDAYNIRIL